MTRKRKKILDEHGNAVKAEERARTGLFRNAIRKSTLSEDQQNTLRSSIEWVVHQISQTSYLMSLFGNYFVTWCSHQHVMLPSSIGDNVFWQDVYQIVTTRYIGDTEPTGGNITLKSDSQHKIQSQRDNETDEKYQERVEAFKKRQRDREHIVQEKSRYANLMKRCASKFIKDIKESCQQNNISFPWPCRAGLNLILNEVAGDMKKNTMNYFNENLFDRTRALAKRQLKQIFPTMDKALLHRCGTYIAYRVKKTKNIPNFPSVEPFKETLDSIVDEHLNVINDVGCNPVTVSDGKIREEKESLIEYEDELEDVRLDPTDKRNFRKVIYYFKWCWYKDKELFHLEKEQNEMKRMEKQLQENERALQKGGEPKTIYVRTSKPRIFTMLPYSEVRARFFNLNASAWSCVKKVSRNIKWQQLSGYSSTFDNVDLCDAFYFPKKMSRERLVTDSYQVRYFQLKSKASLEKYKFKKNRKKARKKKTYKKQVNGVRPIDIPTSSSNQNLHERLNQEEDKANKEVEEDPFYRFESIDTLPNGIFKATQLKFDSPLHQRIQISVDAGHAELIVAARYVGEPTVEVENGTSKHSIKRQALQRQLHNNHLEKYVLSNGRWRHMTGMHQRQLKRDQRRKKLQLDVRSTNLDCFCRRSPIFRDIQEYTKQVVKFLPDMFDEALRYRSLKNKFRDFQMKQKCLYIILRELCGNYDPSQCYLTWGDGSFSPSLKGHASAPNKMFYEFFSHFMPVILVNERNTSKNSYCCETEVDRPKGRHKQDNSQRVRNKFNSMITIDKLMYQTEQLRRRQNGKRSFKVRGIAFCHACVVVEATSQTRKCGKIWSRDFGSALYIGRRFRRQFQSLMTAA